MLQVDLFGGTGMNLSAVLAPPESEGLRRLYHTHAYVCAALAGVALYLLATNTPYSGNYEKLFAAAGPLWLMLCLALIVLTSRDPDKRLNRLVICVVISLGTFALSCATPLL